MLLIGAGRILAFCFPREESVRAIAYIPCALYVTSNPLVYLFVMNGLRKYYKQLFCTCARKFLGYVVQHTLKGLIFAGIKFCGFRGFRIF